jgi:cytochrome b561
VIVAGLLMEAVALIRVGLFAMEERALVEDLPDLASLAAAFLYMMYVIGCLTVVLSC